MLRRLLVLLAAAGIDIAHRLHLLGLLVVDELLHIGVGAQLEVLDRGISTGRMVDFGDALALASQPNRSQWPQYSQAPSVSAFGVGVGLAHVGGRRRERVVAQLLRRLLA